MAGQITNPVSRSLHSINIPHGALSTHREDVSAPSLLMQLKTTACLVVPSVLAGLLLC